MITREEAKKKLWSSGSINTLSKVECDSIINEVFDSLEQHIKSLEAQLSNKEQLTCEGCVHLKQLTDEYGNYTMCGIPIENCSRRLVDRYIAKDTQ